MLRQLGFGLARRNGGERADIKNDASPARIGVFSQGVGVLS